MAHNPKLEIFKVCLGSDNGTFRSLRELKYPSIATNELFKQFFIEFINELDKPEFVKSARLKKGLTAYNTSDPESSLISFSSEQFIIEGVFEGGKYGSRRTKSSVLNKAEKEELDEDKIVMDKYYFLLYTPDTSKNGILFIQSYTGDSVTDLFKNFISKFLTHSREFKKPLIEKFVPKAFIEEFLNGSVLKKFRFNETMLIETLSDAPTEEKTQEFVVRIELESSSGLPNEKLKSLLKGIGRKLFIDKKLSDFSKGKIYVQNATTKKSHPFELDQDFDVKPVIYLDSKVTISTSGTPNFDELKQYCRTILDNEIIPQIYKVNAIKEH